MTSWYSYNDLFFAVALWHQNIVPVYRPKSAATLDITMFCGRNVVVCVQRRDQMAPYFKVPDGKYALEESGY